MMILSLVNCVIVLNVVVSLMFCRFSEICCVLFVLFGWWVVVLFIWVGGVSGIGGFFSVGFGVVVFVCCVVCVV